MSTVLIVVLSVIAILLAALGGLALWTARIARRVEAALPPLGQFLELRGERFHYLERGTGTPIVLIHGLTGQLRNFVYALLEPLSRHHRVVLVDRPGSGYSSRGPRARGDLEVQAAMIAEAIGKLGLERPVVVGHSLGGAVALALALNHPDKVSRLALLAPLTQPTSDAPPAFRLLAVRPYWLRVLVGWTLATPLSILSREKVLKSVFGPDEAPKDFGINGGGFWTLRPASFVAASADLNAAASDMEALQARYRELDVPVDILFGKDDRILDPERNGAAFVRQAPDARLETMAGGHMIPVTHAREVADFIERLATQPLPHTEGTSA